MGSISFWGENSYCKILLDLYKVKFCIVLKMYRLCYTDAFTAFLLKMKRWNTHLVKHQRITFIGLF